MNSLYGALGSPYFRHYDLRMAEAITLSGQLTIMWAERTINEFLNKSLKTDGIDYVIAIDTDSNYVDMSRLVKAINPKDPVEFLDRFAKEVMAPLLKGAFTELGRQQNTAIPRMVMGREAIAQAGFWVAKKNYALLVNDLDGERYEEPEMKIAGLAAIKSDTPELCRGWLKETFKVILTESESATQELIRRKREEFESMEPEKIAKNSGVSNVKKYESKQTLFISGTPINSKAAIVYNHAVKAAGINKKYELIGDGDKISYLSLVPRNPLKQTVIGFKEVFPRELDLIKYIDYKTLFSKTYLKPLTNVLDAIGWEVEPRNTLDGWM